MRNFRGFGWNTATARASLFATAFVFAGSTPIIAYAEKMTELEEVRVTAVEMEERLSAELAQYGSQVEIITKEDIEKTGITDITQALETLMPGLYFTNRQGKSSLGGGTSDLSIMGGARTDVLFLIDGVRINSRSNSQPQIANYGLGMIERIEVIKGGQSLFYGTDSLNGVVNFITKKVSTGSAGSSGLYFGSMGDRGLSGDVSTTVDGHGVLLFGNTDASEGHNLYDFGGGKRFTQKNARQQKRNMDRTSLGGKYRRELGDGQIFNFTVLRGDNAQEYPRSANNYLGENITKDIFATARWDNVQNENLQFFLKAGYHEWWSKWTDLNGYPNALTFANYPADRAKWGYEDWGASFMVDMKQNDGAEYIWGGDYANSYSKEETSGRPATKHQRVLASFLQYRPYLAAVPNMKVALGGRVNKMVSGKTSKDWNVSIKQPLKETAYFRGMMGTAFRLPSTVQTTTGLTTGTKGNPNLQPEKGRGYDVGIGWSSKIRDWPVRFEMGHFYQQIFSLITTDANSVYQNSSGATRVVGYEFQLAMEPHPEWTVDGNMTLADAKQPGDRRQMEARPELFLKGALKFRPSTGRLFVDGVDFNGRYIGNVYEYATGLPDINYGRYVVGDISVFKGFGLRKDHKVMIRVENVLDRVYTTMVDTWGTTSATDLPAGVAAYQQENRGTPRQVTLSYNRDF